MRVRKGYLEQMEMKKKLMDCELQEKDLEKMQLEKCLQQFIEEEKLGELKKSSLTYLVTRCT